MRKSSQTCFLLTHHQLYFLCIHDSDDGMWQIRKLFNGLGKEKATKLPNLKRVLFAKSGPIKETLEETCKGVGLELEL